MQRINILVSFIVLMAVGAVIYLPVLSLDLRAWKEPLLAAGHLLFSGFLLFGMLRSRRVTTALLCSGIFCLNPWLAIFMAKAHYPFYFYLIYMGILVAVIFFGRWYEQFLAFLKNQEPIISWLVRMACIVLLTGLALMTKDALSVFQSEQELWQFRSRHHPNTANLLRGADEMIKSEDPALKKQGEEMYKRAVELDPSDVNAYVRLALLYQKSSRYNDAIKILRQAVKANPAQSEPYLMLAQIYVERDQAKAVIELFNQLLKALPDNDQVYVRMLSIYSQAVKDHPHEMIYQEKREELLAEYEEIIKRKKYSAADFYKLGFLYEQVGGFDEAVRYYNKALALAPNHRQALTSLAHRYQQAGSFKQAVLIYERLIKYYPSETSAYLNMGIIYNAMGNTDKAKYLYNKVIRMDPKSADAYFHLGYVYETAGDLKEALDKYEKAVEVDPKHAEAYYNLGNVYATMEQYPEAIASYLKAVGINPNHLNAFINLSILSFKSRDFKGAIDYLEKAKILGYTPPEEYLKSLEPYRNKN